jgi:hypothetical protein
VNHQTLERILRWRFHDRWHATVSIHNILKKIHKWVFLCGFFLFPPSKRGEGKQKKAIHLFKTESLLFSPFFPSSEEKKEEVLGSERFIQKIFLFLKFIDRRWVYTAY